jgi:hypothetical protein
MGWVLIELPMDDMRIPIATMSAFIEAPFDALNGVEPDDWLPIQGIAYDRGSAEDYLVDAVLAFPPIDGINIGTVNEEKKIFSILVNLSEFAPGAVIRIGLYGFVHSYFIAGGLGDDDPFRGVVHNSDWYGTLTRRYDEVDPITPAGLAGAARYLRLAAGVNPFGYDRLVSSFPELDGVDHEYSGTFPTGQVWGYLWQWHNETDPDYPNKWVYAGSQTVAPIDDANAFIIHTPNSPTITTNWNEGNIKTQGTAAGEVNITIGPFPTLDNQTEFPIPPPDGKNNASMQGEDNVTYWLPTWYFNNDRPVSVNWAFASTPLWTQQALHIYPRPANSYTWETDDYPDRPEMTEIATAVIPSRDDRDGDDTPFNHFGEPRIGTITIVNGDIPGVTFVPEVTPPADGTPDGDGPIGDGTAPGRTDNPQLRVWTYSLDGHDYYVLRLGDFDQLVFDTYSEQWMDWNDYNSLTWRAQCGLNWIGAEALADTYGSNVVAGDDTLGLLWFLDPEQPFDDAPGSGDPAIYFSRVIMGQVPMNGRDVLPCYAVWLTADMGDPAYLGAAVTLWTSDDAGVTWDNHGYISVTADNNSPELSWYSLGQIGAPGRLFKIFDDGAVTRIDAMEMNDPDDEK